VSKSVATTLSLEVILIRLQARVQEFAGT
jgi:hypothetical protein